MIGSDAADKTDGDAPAAMMAGVDQRLLEKSRYGMIPVVADGLKPFTAYAGEADRARAAKMPVVASWSADLASVLPRPPTPS